MTNNTKSHVRTTINGEAVEFLCEPRQSLLECLRDILLLTGAKERCNDGREDIEPKTEVNYTCFFSRLLGYNGDSGPNDGSKNKIYISGIVQVLEINFPNPQEDYST